MLLRGSCASRFLLVSLVIIFARRHISLTTLQSSTRSTSLKLIVVDISKKFNDDTVLYLCLLIVNLYNIKVIEVFRLMMCSKQQLPVPPRRLVALKGRGNTRLPKSTSLSKLSGPQALDCLSVRLTGFGYGKPRYLIVVVLRRLWHKVMGLQGICAHLEVLADSRVWFQIPRPRQGL